MDKDGHSLTIHRRSSHFHFFQQEPFACIYFNWWIGVPGAGSGAGVGAAGAGDGAGMSGRGEGAETEGEGTAIHRKDRK